MTAPLAVRLTGAPPLIEQHRAVLSSIPDRMSLADRDGELILLDASGDGWATRLEVAVRNGTRGILVAAVGAAEDPDAVRAAGLAARGAGVAVVVDRPCSMDRAWREIASEWRRDAGTAALLDSTASTTDDELDQVLLEQLRLVRAIVGRPDRLDTVARAVSTYQVAGTAAGVRISLSAGRGPVPTLAVDLVGIERRRRVEFDGLGLARPARIMEFDRARARTEPLRYESPHRVAWLDLHAAVTGEGTDVARSDLDELAADIAQARHLLDLDRGKNGELP